MEKPTEILIQEKSAIFLTHDKKKRNVSLELMKESFLCTIIKKRPTKNKYACVNW